MTTTPSQPGYFESLTGEHGSVRVEAWLEKEVPNPDQRRYNTVLHLPNGTPAGLEVDIFALSPQALIDLADAMVQLQQKLRQIANDAPKPEIATRSPRP